MISKKKILKGIDQHIENLYLSKVDTELDDSLPAEMKQEIINRNKKNYSELLDIRVKLQNILIG